MNRPLLYFSLLLLAALLLVSYGLSTKRDDRVLDATPILEAGTSSAANPSRSRWVSPLNSDGQSTVQPPTVAPTPSQVGSPLPIGPVLAWPTIEPELYPLATRYPFDTEHIAYQGISYTVRTEAGFGLFSFNNVSPCLCRSLQNTPACSREIEGYLLGAHLAGIVRTEQCLSIELADNRLITFHDISAMTRSVGYVYARSFPDIDYHLLQTWYWEGGEYLLVDGHSGAVTLVPGNPLFSPGNRYFALVFSPGFDTDRYIIQIWSFENDEPRFEKGWRMEKIPDAWRYSQPILTWIGTERFHIHWPLSEGQPAYPDVTVSLKPDAWRVYFGDKPIARPIVEYQSIRFALSLAGIELLDTLHAGKPVYTDRDYVYTSVPNELEGATYFRLPQYFFMGEEPDYFPLEQQMASYLQFQVTDRANVYVALDAKVNELPDWMQTGWQAVDLTLETDDIPLQLYRKLYSAGDMVGLVDRWIFEDRVPSQFIVIVTPASTP